MEGEFSEELYSVVMLGKIEGYIRRRVAGCYRRTKDASAQGAGLNLIARVLVVREDNRTQRVSPIISIDDADGG